MKNMQKILTMLAIGMFGSVGAVNAGSAAPQPKTSDTLADLIAPGATLAIGDKVFSGFAWTATGDNASVVNRLNSEAAQLDVSVSINSLGIYFLDFGGLVAVENLLGSSTLLGDLKLNYTVTANPGSIAMIDQSYTPNALPGGGQIIIGETVVNDQNATVANSTLTLNPTDLSDPGPEAGDNLFINPTEHQLFVTKNIMIAAFAGNLVGLSDIKQSFHQVVPEPSSLGLLSGGLGLLAWVRHARRRKIAD